jgi:Ca2+-binding RTX toxin-like protein
MSNVIGTGSWQMFTSVNRYYTGFLYNQMRLNDTANLPNWIPSAQHNPLGLDLMLQSADTAQRLFRVGGGGTGLLGDQISVSVQTGDAYNQEVASYLAAKYQSTGSVVARNAVLSNTTYNLSLSAVPGTLIDQALLLVDAVSSDTVTTAGADYVNTGAGNDTVLIKDLAFRHIDGGQGYDTLKLAAGFTGTTQFSLTDFISNFRGMSGDTVSNQRVNDAGYHRLLGFEKIDFVQDGETLNRRQIVTVSASDVNFLSDTNTLEFNLGREDVILPTGFSTAESGIFKVNGNYYDRLFTQSVAGQTVNLYTSGGDRVPEMVSFKTIPTLNQVQFAFDHAMSGGTVSAGNFSIEQSGTATSTFAVSAITVNLRQGVQLTLNQPLNNVSKITYTGSLTDSDVVKRGFNHNIWSLGTSASDTLNGSNWSASEQLKGGTFLGGLGNDAITGTSGADLIVGGLGADVLTGGGGSDTFYYRNEVTGSGSSGGLGGTSGDTITDFTWNHVDPTQNDRMDLSLLFEKNFQATGNAVTDAALLTTGLNGSIGGFLDLRKVTNFQTSKQDIEVWADRDGGGLYGILATISNGGFNLPDDYPAVETNQALLTRLIEQGRMVVSTF